MDVRAELADPAMLAVAGVAGVLGAAEVAARLGSAAAGWATGALIAGLVIAAKLIVIATRRDRRRATDLSDVERATAALRRAGGAITQLRTRRALRQIQGHAADAERLETRLRQAVDICYRLARANAGAASGPANESVLREIENAAGTLSDAAAAGDDRLITATRDVERLITHLRDVEQDGQQMP